MHTEPAEKAVHIIYEKDYKTYDDGNVRYIGNSRHYPHYNEDNVVYRIRKREKYTPAKRQTNGKEACADRQRTHNQICGVKRFKNKVKCYRHKQSENEYENYFFLFKPVHSHLYLTLTVRIFKPRDKRKQRHRCAHAEKGDHFTVIGKAERYYSVENIEYNKQKRSHRVAFGVENQSGSTDYGSGKGEITLPVKYAEKNSDEENGAKP